MRLRIAEWRRPSERAIAFRLWTATLYPVEIAVGQSFGEPQPQEEELNDEIRNLDHRDSSDQSRALQTDSPWSQLRNTDIKT